MKVIITEKPSVARDIARVLKVTTRKDGYFEGSGYAVTWAFGHLIRLSDPDAYGEQYKRWDMGNLPILPDVFVMELQKDEGAQNQFQAINTLINNPDCEEVIEATDAGREGELIFRHIYHMAACTKPVKRLWISSQTDQAILEGFAKLREGSEYDPLYDSAKSRSEADWLIGMNATRAYTIRFSQGQGIMSVGRVQTPVLKMIVDRFHANTSFESVPFFEIMADFEHRNGLYKGIWVDKDNETRFYDRSAAQAILDRLEAAKQGVVADITKTTKQEKPPLLYDLTELQKDANKRYKFSADTTLKLAQSLYERHKIITYPRTSSRYLSADLKPKIPALLHHLVSLPEYEAHAKTILSKDINYSKRLFDDQKVTDHHAIILTDKKPELNALSQDERRLFDLIAKRFLAGFFPDCKKELTQIITMVDADKFRSNGTVIKAIGWREVYQVDKQDAADEEKEDGVTLLPVVAKSDTVAVGEKVILERKTQAPPLYTEATILAAMETAGRAIEDEELRQAIKDCGLGTPATRAQILERLIQVSYITRDKTKLVPTPKGIQLISYIQDKALLSPELTGEWEKKLQQIVSKDYNRETYMTEIRQFAQEIVQNVRDAEVEEVVIPVTSENALGVCPTCSSSVIETPMSYSCMRWKSGCTFKIWKKIAEKEISPKQAKKLLKEGKTKPIKGFKSREGKSFDAGLLLSTEGKVVFEFVPKSEEIVGKCPLCQGDVTVTPKAYGYSNWKTTGCSFVIWRQIASKDITTDIVKTLLSAQKTDKLDGFKSKAGNLFSAALVLKEGKVELNFN